MKAPTPAQQAVLDVIRQSVYDRGFPPTFREIQEMLGLRSTASVARILKTLQRDGFIARDPGSPRAITIL